MKTQLILEPPPLPKRAPGSAARFPQYPANLPSSASPKKASFSGFPSSAGRKSKRSPRPLPGWVQFTTLLLCLLQSCGPVNRITRDESGAGGVVTHVVFSGGTSVAEYDGTNTTPTVEYIRGSDYGGGVGSVVYTVRGATPSYTHENRRGDVVARTDASGSLTWQGQYNGSGKQVAKSGATLDRQGPNTKDQDGWGGINEGNRYTKIIGGDLRLFLTRDPAMFIDGPNLYAYCGQNPFTKFDPEGLDANDTQGGWFGMTLMLDDKEVPLNASNEGKAIVQNMGTFGNAVIGAGKSVADNVQNDATLAHQGAVVATSDKTTVQQKIEGGAVAVAAVADVGTMVTPEGGVESTAGHAVAGDAVKGAIEGSARQEAEKTAASVGKGGSGPVTKGQEGVDKSEAQFVAVGGTIKGKEVTFELPSGKRTRADLTGTDAQGKATVIESKNGPTATLTKNQKEMQQTSASGGTVIPRGQNAADAGLTPGKPIPAPQYQVDQH